MPSIIKKTKKGKAYYYAVQSKRINGKPRVIWQKYLGSVDAIVKKCEESSTPTPTETVLFEAGGVAALLQMATRLGVIDLVNQVVPKREQGPSVGHYLLLAALNRALDPSSKVQIGDWYHDSVLQRLWQFPKEAFSSQRYWDHMDMISEKAVDQIQNFLTNKARQEFKLDTQCLLYDSTNFFTHIDTHNDRCSLPQRGHNKQKRSDLRQINMALLTTREFQIPLLHKAYEGNVNDSGFFPEMVQDLLARHRAIFGSLSDATLIFDKGHLYEEIKEKLLHSGIHFIAGIKADVHPEIFSKPLGSFVDALNLPGTKYYATTIEVYGKPCQAIVSYSESFFTQQLASITTSMAKCQDKLKELQNNLLSWTKEERRQGTRPTKAAVQDRLREILSPQYMKEIFEITIRDVGGISCIQYRVNRENLDRLSSLHLGRTLLLTNRHQWLPVEVISSYRDLAHVEDAFKNMKNRDYLRWQPAFHWTDQKIRVHSLYCVLALLLATLARRMAWENGHQVSLSNLLDDLTAIKEVAIFYSKDGRAKPLVSLSSMTTRQKKLADLFEFGDILSAG